jgi:hypothetical protein
MSQSVGQVRVAAVYFGRFFSDSPYHYRDRGARPKHAVIDRRAGFALAWRVNHVQNLLKPNDATVIVVGHPDSWCGASNALSDSLHAGRWKDVESEFHASVRAAWAAAGWSNYIYTAFMRSDNSSELKAEFKSLGSRVNTASRRAAVSSFAVGHNRGFLTRWYIQYRSVAQTQLWMRVALEHDIIIRARADLQFDHPVYLPAETRLASGQVDLLALKQCDAKNEGYLNMRSILTKFGPMNLTGWNDWVYVGTPAAWRVLSEMISGNVCISPNIESGVRSTPDGRKDLNGTAMRRTMLRGYGMYPEEQTVLQFAQRGLAVHPLHWNVSLVRSPFELTSLSRTSEGNQTCAWRHSTPPVQFRGGRACAITPLERGNRDPCVPQ